MLQIYLKIELKGEPSEEALSYLQRGRNSRNQKSVETDSGALGR